MTTYSFDINLSGSEVWTLREALRVYAHHCKHPKKALSINHQRHLENIAAILERLTSNPVLSSFTYYPGNPESEELLREWNREREPKEDE